VYPQRTVTAKAMSHSCSLAPFLALERYAFSHPHRFAVLSPVPVQPMPGSNPDGQGIAGAGDKDVN